LVNFDVKNNDVIKIKSSNPNNSYCLYEASIPKTLSKVIWGCWNPFNYFNEILFSYHKGIRSLILTRDSDEEIFYEMFLVIVIERSRDHSLWIFHKLFRFILLLIGKKKQNIFLINHMVIFILLSTYMPSCQDFYSW